jgi:short subunit dehydrogenase-like uncharacterized protein
LNSSKILLLGATGYTGRLVAQELIKQNISFTFSGQNPEKLQLLAEQWQQPFLKMDLLSDEDLGQIPSETEYILNCAGPFNLFAIKLLEKIGQRKIKYLDVSGEESFVFNSYRMVDEQPIHSTLIHACAFESFIADALAASLNLGKEPLEDLSSFYHFSSHRVSPGTRLSMALVRNFQTFIFENEKWLPKNSGEKVIDIQFRNLTPEINKAVFAPYPEIIFFARNYQTKNAGSYLLMNEDHVSALTMSPRTAQPLEHILTKHRAVVREGPNAEERRKGHFLVGVRAKKQDGSEKRATLRGTDSYQITASIAVETLKQLILRKETPSGIFAPSELADSMAILRSLTDDFELQFAEGLKP